MFATIVQIVGLLCLIAAGVMVSPAAIVAAFGVVCVFVGLAADRGV